MQWLRRLTPQDYNRQTLIDDLIAGATGAVAGAPQAMGFAVIAGISPIYGLYTSIVSTIVASLFTSSRLMTVAATNALALVVGTTLLRFDEAQQLDRLFMLTFLIGVIQLGFGLLKLGDLTRFVSNAVMTGFITGAGLLIMLGQVSHLTGYEYQTGSRAALPRFWDWLSHLDYSDGRTALIGVISVIALFILHQTRVKNISTLIVILIASTFVAVTGWHTVGIVSDISPVPGALPSPVMPHFNYAPDLIVAALAIAVLGSVQSAAITASFADHEAKDDTPPDVNRDFVAQGLANMAGGFFQNMASGGSLSRTAVNVNSGGRTRLANIYAAVFIALMVLVLAPFIERVVMAALAAHLIVAATSVIRPRMIWIVWNVNVTARITLIGTFASTLLLPLEYSIYIGVGLSLALYIYTSSRNIHVVRLVLTDDQRFKEADLPDELPSAEPVILSVSGNLYFAAVTHLQQKIPSPGTANRPVVILRLRDNQYLGSTGIRFLEVYDRQLRARDGKLILAGVSQKVRHELERTDHLQYFGENGVFLAGDVLFDATEHALEYAEQWLAEPVLST